MNKHLLLFPALFLSHAVTAYEINNLQMHGFFTQNVIHTSENNMYGESKNSVSTDFTEAGLNLFYAPMERLSFSFQSLYRNAGKVDTGSLDVDYAFADFTIKKYQQGRYGLRIGRVKNPLGLYNETRDVAFTSPSIILPQGIYYDRSRSLLLSSDGVHFYWEHLLENGDINIKLGYGKPRNDNDELLNAIIPFPTPVIPLSPQGNLNSSGADPAVIGQIIYEHNGGETIYAFSFADTSLSYEPVDNDPFSAGTTDFRVYMLSAQYNGEKFNLTGEYLYQENDFKGFGFLFPDSDPVSESWYLQAGYRLNYKWQIYGRYDESYLNNDDRTGKTLDSIQLPGHIVFSKDVMMGVRWDINSSIMLRAEYHNLNGSSWLTSADNPDRAETKQYWDLFALQLSLRF